MTAERRKLNKIKYNRRRVYVGLISLNENGSLLLPLCVQHKVQRLKLFFLGL